MATDHSNHSNSHSNHHHHHSNTLSSSGGSSSSFVRAAHQRSSLRSFPPSATPSQVEHARQRALAAADYYQRAVSDGTGTGSLDEGTNGGTGTGSSNVAAHSSADAYYKQKLRAGFIDLRNSYNEKRPRVMTASSVYRGQQDGGGRRMLERVKENTPPATVASTYNQRRIYRSNSSLELENLDYDPLPPQSQHTQQAAYLTVGGGGMRTYGSASSLERLSTSGESFFAMLQDYRNENVDQRAPPPPQVHEVLRGDKGLVPPVGSASALGRGGEKPQNKQTNGTTGLTPAMANLDDDALLTTTRTSPRLKSKSMKLSKERKKERAKSVVSEASSGILKKLRGTKSDPNNMALGGSTESNIGEAGDSSVELITPEENQRRKALVHYDSHSIGVNLAAVARQQRTSGSGDGQTTRKNVTTGASAASRGKNHAAVESNNSDEPEDEGDGKGNDLVLSCPYFRNELGGEEQRTLCLNRSTAQRRVQQLLGNGRQEDMAATLLRHPVCNGLAVLDSSHSPHGTIQAPIIKHRGLVMEFVDQGALYYRHFFQGTEHQNFFGIDDNLGPVAISLKREKCEERKSPTEIVEDITAPCYQYRIILRTSQLTTLRCCILEDAIPSSSRLSNTKGLPPKDVLDYILPPDTPLNPACLKVALPGPKTTEKLCELDEQGIHKNYKIGVMYCRAGQSSEEDMYNNEHGSPLFDDFLNMLGTRVSLKGFEKYRGGLDVLTDTSGTESVFCEHEDGYEIMFHVCTMLPYTPKCTQQVLRKSRIGNDIVTIIFQEPGAEPFTPRSVRSHFQHVFIIVRAHRTAAGEIRYSLAVSRSKDVPPFGPPFKDGALFKPGHDFAYFLRTKAINAENAAHRADKFAAMAMRTRQQCIKDLANECVSSTSLEAGSKLSKFSLGSGRKKEKVKTRPIPDMFSCGAIVWMVQAEDFALSEQLSCYLGISADFVLLIEEHSKEVLFTCRSKSVIGWTSNKNSLRLFYDHGECIAMRTQESDVNEVAEIVQRLEHVSLGCETQEMTLRRNHLGQLGFHVHYEGIVSDVEAYGYAWHSGLRSNSRLVEICKVATATLTHDQMIDLLRTSVQVKVIVIPPNENGNARRGEEDTLMSMGSSTLHLMSNSLPASDDESSHSSHPPPPRGSSQHRPLPPSSLSSASLRYQPPGQQQQQKTGGGNNSNTNLITTLPQQSYISTLPDQTLSRPVTTTTTTTQAAYSSSSSHMKQPSQDSSGGSRSSGHGSLERTGGGSTQPQQQGSSGEERRFDTMSSEGFFSADEQRSLEKERERAAAAKVVRTLGGWSGKVTIYPAYNRDNQPQTQQQQVSTTAPSSSSTSSTMSPRSTWQPTSNQQQSNQTPEAQQPQQFVSKAYVGKQGKSAYGATSYSPSAGASRKPANYGMSPRGGDGGNHLTGSGDLGVAVSGNKQQQQVEQMSRQQEAEDGSSSQNSPAGRHRQVAFRAPPHPPHRNFNASPHSNSPRTNFSQRGGANASDENLSGTSSSGTASSSRQQQHGRQQRGGAAASHRILSTTFQDDLKRLIDPDVSFTESDPDKSDRVGRTSRGNSSGRGHGLHRTLSHESLCGGKYHQRVPDQHDVIFTTAVPAQVLPPRPPQRKGGGADGSRDQRDEGLAASNPALPLPDPTNRLDWDSLLEVANQAFQGSPPEMKASSMGSELHVAGQQTTKEHPRLTTSRSATTSYWSDSAQHAGTGGGGDSADNESVRMYDLADRCAQLEQMLRQESAEKEELVMEVEQLRTEVDQLRTDNVHLQEESQTAAAQLRRFTEWFFQTIDRQ